MARKRIGVGLIGAGWMGRVHSKCLTTQSAVFGPDPEISLEVVVDITEELARNASSSFGFKRYATDWREVIDDPSVDIVDIVTPNDAHYDIAMAAIARGKHIYCEKPLANDAGKAREMTDAAERAGVITMVGFNYIKNPVQTLVRRVIADGEIGEVKHFGGWMNSDFMGRPDIPHSWRNETARAGSGAIGDIGSHMVAFFYHLVGREFVDIISSHTIVVPERPAPTALGGYSQTASGKNARTIRNQTDDISTTMFHFDGGTGQFECSRVALGRRVDIGYAIVGTKGSVRYSYDHINRFELYREEGPVELRGFTQIEMGPSDPRFAAFHPIAGLGLGYDDYKTMELRDMIDAVIAGKPAYPDFGFATRVQRIVDSAIRSDAERRWVELSEMPG